MSILPLTIPPKKLAQTISSTATSFKLNNIVGWEGQNLTPADFGTEAFCVFINATRTQIEIMKIDPATIANASITILARGLDYLGGETPDPSRQYAWASNETTVQLGTDAPQLFRDFMSETNPATVTALHTYDTLPQSTVAPVADEDFTNKEYVDGLTQPAITVRINQAAHGFVVGDVIRLSGVNTYAKAQADSPANAEVIGIVTVVDDVDNFRYITEGIVTDGVPVFAAGSVLFLSRTTAGELVDTDTTTIGEVSFPLAVISESGVRMIFHKYRPAVINSISGNPIASETVAGSVEEATQAQADAKTSTGETGAKLFVPPNKIRAANYNDYVVDAGVTDAYAIAPSPAITAYSAGQIFTFKVLNTNTGASTLNVSGVGAQAITVAGAALVGGELVAGSIVVVAYDGTNFELANAASLPPSNPIPAYMQLNGTSQTETIDANGYQKAMTATADGSELFVYNNGSIYRFARDAASGQFIQTHRVAALAGHLIDTNRSGTMIVIGDFVYLFAGNPTIEVSRYLKADLSGGLAMTIPSLASNGYVMAWTDGIDAYLISSSTATVARKWILSGTTFTAGATVTAAAGIMTNISINHGSVFNGTDAYIIGSDHPTTYPFFIRKLTNIDGSAYTQTTVQYPRFSDSEYQFIGAPIDDTRMYLGGLSKYYDETGVIGTRITLVPISNP